MKVTGVVLLAVGLLWLVLAMGMSTTVTAGGKMVGSVWIPTRSVHNIGLQDERRNQMMLGGLVTLAGVLLFGFGSVRAGQEGLVLGGSGKPPVLPDAPCPRDLSLEAYRVWLVARYEIVRNEVLNGYVCRDKVFSSADDALAHAHGLELAAQAVKAAEFAAAEAATAAMQQQAAAALEQASQEQAARAESRREWLAQNRAWFVPAVIALGVGLVVAAGLAYRQHTQQVAAMAAAQATVKQAEKLLVPLEVRLSAATAARSKAVTAAGEALRVTESSKVRVTLQPGILGMGYVARVTNGSRYHLKDLSGTLKLYSRGLEWKESPSFSCCDEAKDRDGFGLDFDVAPGRFGTNDYAVGLMAVTVDSPSAWKLVNDHALPVKRPWGGQAFIVLDAAASFSGGMTFVSPPVMTTAGDPSSYRTKEIDFNALAETQGNWTAFDASIDAARVAVVAQRKSLEEAKAALAQRSKE